MSKELELALEKVRALTDEYRARCMWFLREDYYPQSTAEACRVLEYIERYGDVEAFRKAATLRQWISKEWLSQSTKEPSAG